MKKKYKIFKKESKRRSNTGFSFRFNLFLSYVEGLNIRNSNEKGYFSDIAKITGHSKPAVSVWLKKDGYPRDYILSAIVRFFLQYIPNKELNPVVVEAWLRYGDTATPNPFNKKVKSGHYGK